MASFHLFENGRPETDTLKASFGVTPPAMFVRFAQWCYDRVGGDKNEAVSLYWTLLSLEAYDLDSNSCGSPFELFSIGDWDGDSIGWIVLAQESPAEDWPWGWYHHDGGNVSVLAKDTPEFFTKILSHALVAEPGNEQDVIDAAAHLGLSVSKELGASVAVFGSSKYYETGEPAPSLHVEVPAGYQYIPTQPAEEGLGVLAPESKFAATPHLDDRKLDPVDVARDHYNNGHTASALWHLLLPHTRYLTENYGDWLKLTQDAYLDLGRPRIAARAEEHDG